MANRAEPHTEGPRDNDIRVRLAYSIDVIGLQMPSTLSIPRRVFPIRNFASFFRISKNAKIKNGIAMKLAVLMAPGGDIYEIATAAASKSAINLSANCQNRTEIIYLPQRIRANPKTSPRPDLCRIVSGIGEFGIPLPSVANGPSVHTLYQPLMIARANEFLVARTRVLDARLSEILLLTIGGRR